MINDNLNMFSEISSKFVMCHPHRVATHDTSSAPGWPTHSSMLFDTVGSTAMCAHLLSGLREGGGGGGGGEGRSGLDALDAIVIVG